MDAGDVILGLFIGLSLAPLVILGVVFGWAWIRHALLPIWPWPELREDYSDMPIECHPRYNAHLGRLVD